MSDAEANQKADREEEGGDDARKASPWPRASPASGPTTGRVRPLWVSSRRIGTLAKTTRLVPTLGIPAGRAPVATLGVTALRVGPRRVWTLLVGATGGGVAARLIAARLIATRLIAALSVTARRALLRLCAPAVAGSPTAVPLGGWRRGSPRPPSMGPLLSVRTLFRLGVFWVLRIVHGLPPR